MLRVQTYGGLIMSASHNPGGPKNDWGIKVSRSDAGRTAGLFVCRVSLTARLVAAEI